MSSNNSIQNKLYDDAKRFSKDNVSLSKDFPIKFCCFNAYQMRDLIIRKLIEDPATRNQVYPGSNISILVDLVSTMYQTLTYQLNHAASESMFSQSQYYENIVRIAKLLGYNAGGITPSTSMFRIDDVNSILKGENGDIQDVMIPPFAMVNTQDGKYYSYSPNTMDGCQIPKNYSDGKPFDILLHNGIWKRYQTVLTPNGSDFETFVLNMIRSEINEQKYATTSHMFAVEVLKKYVDGDKNQVDWSATDINVFQPVQYGLFKCPSNPNETLSDQPHDFLYKGNTGNSKVFNVELNELKQIVIKFGDGITTSKLNKDSELYIFYLETQGMNGQVVPSKEQLKFSHNATMFNLPQPLYERIFGKNPFGIVDGNTPDVQCHVLTSSTSAIKEEGPDEIRERAPHWFKMNNRLVTKEDYQFYIMNEPSISGVFNSVKVMNNWEYTSTFYRWLNQLGIAKHDNPRFYLNPARFTKYGGASLSDPVDTLNVYVWYITNFGKVDDINYDQVIQRCKSMMSDIRDMCQEPVFLPAIPVKCEISSVPEEKGLVYLTSSRQSTVPKIDVSETSLGRDASWLEIRINNDYSISGQEIIERVCSLFTYFFNVNNHQVGFGSFNTNDLVNLIHEKIPAISEIYTVYQESSNSSPIYTHGISMATYITNTSLINLGDDLQIKSGNIQLEPFMYPVLYTNTEQELKDRIKVVNKNVNILARNNY